MQLVAGHVPEYLPVVRELFREYADATGLNFCFQNFDQELAELPGKYAPPSGRLVLALNGAQPAGCVALRKIEKGICEMKRLYVRPAFRNQGVGGKLATQIISEAREIGYQRMRLDTLNTMRPAIALYESLGFKRIAPYYHNPIAEAVYFELEL
ncbi:MAG TPA: GNAT family N-acetyltransferase [Verrucomicrobiae bacterium]|nr:GNAT family N-acetyltransferase [Verrucomicrobiae bacterium]